MDRLHKLGAWLDVNGEGIFDTRPWVKASSSPEVRFTTKNNSLYAYVEPKSNETSLSIPGIKAVSGTRVRVLGSNQDSPFKQQDGTLVIPGDPGWELKGYARGVRITPIPEA
jgi:alpha-L-fucosidase